MLGGRWSEENVACECVVPWPFAIDMAFFPSCQSGLADGGLLGINPEWMYRAFTDEDELRGWKDCCMIRPLAKHTQLCHCPTD
ncbi:uncharacterized protein L203_102467 [Cryptococcus depauperatus CBS 7841]|uniref:Uncharacterized protein n=1 Tax=Cryptococcus depauperatus CBS 7841 TaxID=1295531 RepID=A0AAJ8JS06_9TREE